MSGLFKKIGIPFAALVLSVVFMQAVSTPTVQAATCGPTTNFITTWKTDNPGTSNSSSIRIPTTGGGYNYSVDWNNDGVMDETGLTDDVTHDFGSPGTYTIQICGAFPRIYFNNNHDKEKIVSIDQWGDNGWTDMQSAFFGASNLEGNYSDAPDLSGAVNLGWMFRNASSFNGQVNNWDTSTVTSLWRVFNGASSFNQPINNWETGNVTDMRSVFGQASSFNQPVSNWDTGEVLLMQWAFQDAAAFNQDISSWNTEKVTTMRQMFQRASSFNQNINSWNTAQVTDMFSMFSGASAFNQPLNNWNTAKVTTMGSMFTDASSFNGQIGNWNTGLVNSMNYMFYNATSFDQSVANWQTGEVTTMRAMFKNARQFDQPIGNWNTVKVTDMQEMFNVATSFNQDIGNWNTAEVTSMKGMFSGVLAYNAELPTVSLESFEMQFNQDIGDWNTSKVQDMYCMFCSTTAARQLEYQNRGYTEILQTGVDAKHPFAYALGDWDVSALLVDPDGNEYWTGATSLLSGASLSPQAYDATLTAWAEQTLISGVTFGADGVGYCNALDARAAIVSQGWSIQDEGRQCFYLTLSEGSGIVAYDADSGLSLASIPTNIGETRTVLLKKGGIPLALVTVRFTQDLDWSLVTGSTDRATFKSVVEGLASVVTAPGVTGTHTLYVPHRAGDNAVVICPEASQLHQVTATCSSAQTYTAQDAHVGLVTIDNVSYWRVDGLTGTGGVSYTMPSLPNTGIASAAFIPIVAAAAALGLVGIIAITVRRPAYQRVYYKNRR